MVHLETLLCLYFMMFCQNQIWHIYLQDPPPRPNPSIVLNVMSKQNEMESQTGEEDVNMGVLWVVEHRFTWSKFLPTKTIGNAN